MRGCFLNVVSFPLETKSPRPPFSKGEREVSSLKGEKIEGFPLRRKKEEVPPFSKGVRGILTTSDWDGVAVQLLVVVLVCLIFSTVAFAEDKSAVSPAHIKLPKGPGSLDGVGENVEPNLNMGLMSYGIPIVVPGGYAGLSPSMRISYSSGSPSSVVGMGWNFTSSSIERMTSKGIPFYNRDDRFAANGSDELVRVSDVANVYRARFEGGFVRYTWVDVDGGGKEGYWIAEYPDGRIGYFGAKADGTTVPESRLSGDMGTFRYAMVEMVDTLGHRMAYEYEKIDGAPALKRVGYVWRNGTPRYQVVLEYDSRPDVLSDAKPGFETLLSVRLTGISVLSSDAQLRRYALTYEEIGGLSRLSRVDTFGMNDDDGPFPVVFDFGYTGGAGHSCALGTCASPEIQTIAGASGVNIQTGAADLVDLNGDSLPDIIDTSTPRHTVYLNERFDDGFQTTQQIAAGTLSQSGSMDLRAGQVRMLDVDGNGFADMVDAESKRVLFNRGSGEWENSGVFDNFTMPNLAEDQNARPMDVDNDGCIDILHCDADTCWYWQNDCAGTFTLVEKGVTGAGGGFSEGALQLADMNGDGLQDLVRMAADLVVYWLNFGRGRWSDAREMAAVPSGVELGYRLTDLNGDSLADLVRVSGNTVAFSLNQNGSQFANVETIESSASLNIPEVTNDVSVRFADMNGSGSTDVVWIDSSGAITFLELFPERPNLLSSVSNGIGKDIFIEYGSTTEHMARDGGPAAWRYRIPHPMLTVDAIRVRDALSGVEQVQRFHYRDAYWDASEKQFRGFAEVHMFTDGDDTVEPRHDVHQFNVGFDSDGQPDPYYKGLPEHQMVFSGATESAIEESFSTYAPCELTDVPQNTVPPIRHICQQDTTKVVKEGQSEDQWVTLREAYAYDGYGNRTYAVNYGVVSRGGGPCPPCSGTTDDYGAPCGADCSGDEAFEQTEFISPENTGGQWILNKPAQKIGYGKPDSDRYTQEVYYYDGAPFVGLTYGQLTQGLLTRSSVRVNTDNQFIDTARSQYNAHGAPVAVMDGNGNVRTLAYDADSVLVTDETVQLENYALNMSVAYHPVLDQVVASSGWYIGQADDARMTRYAYDGFGRITGIAAPGDSLDTPTQSFEYDIALPVSRIVTRGRSATNGPADLESVQCFDGLGRELQSRTRVEEGKYQVSGFTEYNSAGKPSYAFYAHLASDDACAVTAPNAADVPAVLTQYDGTARPRRVFHPGAAPDDELSYSETVYLPMETRGFDEADVNPVSGHFNTPLITRVDGLGRTVEHVRYLTPDQPVPLRFTYDESGNLKGYVDVHGNQKVQTYDLLGRVRTVDDPDTGRTSFVYDSMGNAVAETDSRGVTIRRSFDKANRIVSEWEDGNDEATRIRYYYDTHASCENCTNAEGLPVSIVYPMADESPAMGIDFLGYDQRGQQTWFRRDMGRRSFEFSTVFDNAGRVTEKHFPGDMSLSYQYDGADRLVAVPGTVAQVTYDSRGLNESVWLSNGVKTTYTHDNRLRLETLNSVLPTGTPLQAYSYKRDPVGNIVNITDDAAIDGERSANAQYNYDAWYRLTGAVLDQGRAHEESLSYAYDEIDNIVSKASSLPNTSRAHVGTYTYGEGTAGPHAVTTAGNHLLTYDAAGNAIAYNSDTYTWDFKGRMSLASQGEKELARFDYGPGFDRVKKTEGTQTTYYITPEFEVRDGIATLYVLLGNERLSKIEKAIPNVSALPDLAPLTQDAQGNVTSTPDNKITAADAWAVQASINGTFSFTSQHDDQKITELLTASARRMLANLEDTATKQVFYHHDHLGSVAAVTDVNGTLLERRTQYPYGLDRTPNYPFNADYLFTGKEPDRSTGLVYFGARYYTAVLGRWMSADPLYLTQNTEKKKSITASPNVSFSYSQKLSSGSNAESNFFCASCFNRKLYSGNSPNNRVDPNGLDDTYIEGSMKIVTPFGGAVWGSGAVWDDDNILESAIFVESGANLPFEVDSKSSVPFKVNVLGAEISMGIALGRVARDIEGSSTSVSTPTNIPYVSLEAKYDDAGINGAEINVGLGGGASLIKSNTEPVITGRDVMQAMFGYLNEISFGTFPPQL